MPGRAKIILSAQSTSEVPNVFVSQFGLETSAAWYGKI